MSETNVKRGGIAKTAILILNIVLLFVLLEFLPFSSLENKGIAIVVFAGILWLTECVHITITALSIPLLAVFLGVFNTTESLANYSNPVIYLFLAGFAISAALNANKIDKYIAYKILHLSGGSYLFGALGIFTVTFFLSMWISNTATTAMILPIVLGILRNLDPKKERNTFVFFLLGIAYSATIGGISTVIGSPPNGITAAATKLEFYEYFKMAAPMAFVSFPLMILTLYIILRPNFNHKLEIQDEEVINLNGKRITTIVIFTVTAILWMFSKPISAFLGSLLSIKTLTSFDTIISFACIIALCIFKSTTWKNIQDNTSWGILLLFGGGIALSNVIKKTGVSLLISNGVQSAIADANIFVIALVLAAIIVILTEFMSNTASAALLVPIFMSFAAATGLNAVSIAMIIGLGANAAFVLPVATPPNALAYGTGYIKQSDMLKVGFVLNVIFMVLIALFATYYWGI